MSRTRISSIAVGLPGIPVETGLPDWFGVTPESAPQDRILKILDLEEDSVRFYHLGNNWRNRIDHYGMKGGFDIEGPLA